MGAMAPVEHFHRALILGEEPDFTIILSRFNYRS